MQYCCMSSAALWSPHWATFYQYNYPSHTIVIPKFYTHQTIIYYWIKSLNKYIVKMTLKFKVIKQRTRIEFDKANYFSWNFFIWRPFHRPSSAQDTCIQIALVSWTAFYSNWSAGWETFSSWYMHILRWCS